MHARLSLLSTLATLTLLTQPTTSAQPLGLPTTPHRPRACPNALANPSFEAPTLAPWSAFYTGSWASHGPVTGTAQAGARYFAAQSNSTNASTITLSQSISLPTGAKTGVRCEAWVRADGRASFEVFVGGMSCGSRALEGTGRWVRVGGDGVVYVGSGEGEALVVVAGVVEGGVRVGVDGMLVC